MSKRYFLKELVNNPVNDSTGSRIPFTHGADDMGFLELDTETDAKLLAEIAVLTKARRGGVYEVDEAMFNKEKKKQPSTKLANVLQKQAPRLFEVKKDPFRSPSRGIIQEPITGLERGAAPAVAEQPAVPPAKRTKGTFKPKAGKA